MSVKGPHIWNRFGWTAPVTLNWALILLMFDSIVLMFDSIVLISDLISFPWALGRVCRPETAVGHRPWRAFRRSRRSCLTRVRALKFRVLPCARRTPAVDMFVRQDGGKLTTTE